MLKRIVYIMLVLIVFISSCSTFKLAEIVSHGILDNINYGGYRYDNSSNSIISHMAKTEEEDLTISDSYFNVKEVRNMENGLNEVITALGSAIAGVYCLVKTIINLIKKIKK